MQLKGVMLDALAYLLICLFPSIESWSHLVIETNHEILLKLRSLTLTVMVVFQTM